MSSRSLNSMSLPRATPRSSFAAEVVLCNNSRFRLSFKTEQGISAIALHRTLILSKIREKHSKGNQKRPSVEGLYPTWCATSGNLFHSSLSSPHAPFHSVYKLKESSTRSYVFRRGPPMRIAKLYKSNRFRVTALHVDDADDGVSVTFE